MKGYLSKIGNKFKKRILKENICKFLKKNGKAVFNFLGLFVFLLLLIPYILQERYQVKVDNQYLVSVVDIIITLMPMIFTIVAISLSLPSEKIYGITHIQFRRLRKSSLSFLMMIVITIIIFALYTIFKILGMVLYIWALDAISLIYSIWFVCQEIPILTKNDRTIIRITKKAWLKRDEPINKDLVYLVQCFITEKGMTQVYNLFKTKDNGKKKVLAKNEGLLESLLSIYNEYFFELSDKINIIKGLSADSFKNIAIIEAVDKAFSNLEDLLTFNNDFDIVKIYGNSKEYYHLTRLMFNLKALTDVYEATSLFKAGMNRLLSKMFFILNYRNNDEGCKSFILALLNAMISTTVSENELWFIEIMRDHQYNSRFSVVGQYSEYYYYFLSMYLYYLVEQCKSVPEDFKKNILSFLNAEADGINADGSNWKQIFRDQVLFCEYSNIVSLLPGLLNIVKEGVFSWYQPNHRISVDCGFCNSFVIRCWLELLLFNYKRYQFNEKEFDNVIQKLNNNDKEEFARELNINWFDNNNNTINKQKDDKLFLAFYKAEKDISINDENNIIKKLNETRTIINYKNLQSEFEQTKHDVDYDLRLKEKLVKGFDKAIAEISVYDATINLNDVGFRCYDLLFDTRWDDIFIDRYINKLPEALNMLMYDTFENDKSICQKIINKATTNEEIEGILKNYQFKGGNEYLFRHFYRESVLLSNLKSKKELELPFPYLVLSNNKSIGINLVCDEEKSIVRKLNSNEINQIIDRDFKVINGLYKYCESRDDSRTMFITREQVFDLIEKKYYYARIVFKYKLLIDYDNVLVIKVEEDENEDGIDPQDDK